MLPGEISFLSLLCAPIASWLQNPLPWPERVCNALWSSVEASPADKAVAIKLGYGDWGDLSVAERVPVGGGGSHSASLLLNRQCMQVSAGNSAEYCQNPFFTPAAPGSTRTAGVGVRANAGRAE